jgi:hypothetical protein
MATWNTRTAPRDVKLEYVMVVFQKPVAALSADGETILAKPDAVRFAAAPDMPVDAFRAMLVERLAISPRKLVVIRWYGTELQDGRTLGQYRVSDGSTFDVSVKGMTISQLAELAKARPLERVRVQTLAGRSVTVDRVSAQTTPRQLRQIIVDKHLIEGLSKANAESTQFYFSHHTPLLAPGMLPLLADDAALGARRARHCSRADCTFAYSQISGPKNSSELMRARVARASFASQVMWPPWITTLSSLNSQRQSRKRKSSRRAGGPVVAGG